MTPPAPALLKIVRPDDAADADLLARFADARDEPAFAELVRRYGPLVWGVCRRTAGHAQDAEDAFQAVFLVLARRAGTVREPGKLAGFLHGTAVRIGRKARRRAARRREVQVSVPERPTPAAEVSDVHGVIDAELARLPEWYRLPVLLCDVQGLSRADAAARLNVPEGTISSRLAAGRKRLAERLAKRGLVPAVGGLLAAVPADLSAKAVSVAVGWAAGGAVPAAVGALVGAGGRIMRAVLLAGGFGVAVALGAAAGGPGDGPKKADEPAKPAVVEKKADGPAKADAAAVPIGRPKMRTVVDLDHAPQSLCWVRIAQRDSVIVATSGEGRWQNLIWAGLPPTESPTREWKAFRLASGETLVGTVSLPEGGYLLASTRRESQGINAIHQLNVRPLAQGKSNLSIPLDAATGTEIGLTSDAAHALIRVDLPATGGGERRSVVQRLDLKTGEPDGAELVVSGGLAAVAFAPDGARVVGVTAKDQTARCWSFPDGKEVWSHALAKPADTFVASFSADGRTVAVAATKRWDERDPRIGPGQLEEDKATDLLNALKADIGTGLTVLRSADGSVSRSVRATASDQIYELAVSHDGRLVVSKTMAMMYTRGPDRPTRDRNGNVGTRPGQVSVYRRSRMEVYDTAVGGVIHTWPNEIRSCVAFAPDRHVLAIAESVTNYEPVPPNGTRTIETGRLGFWHFDPAPAKK